MRILPYFVVKKKKTNHLSLVRACSISGHLPGWTGWCLRLPAGVQPECAEQSRGDSCSCPVAQQCLLRQQPQAGVCWVAGAMGCATGVAVRPLVAWLKVSRVTCPADLFFFFLVPL